MRDLDCSHRIGRARLLRRGGKTYDEIRAVVGPVSDDTLRAWLRGIPRPPETNRTGRALPEERRKARQLRAQGLTITEISEAIGVAKGTISPWIRDVTAPRRETAASRERTARARAAAARTHHERAVRRSALTVDRAAGQIGGLNPRELLLVGAALYWAEGTKEKPWRRGGRVIFTNSDASVARVFLAWLELVGVAEVDIRYRLSIHETADARTHEEWWAAALGRRGMSFQRATLKRHNPKPVRYNTGATYHGCLVISVMRPRVLYDSIVGWWQGIAEGAAPASSPDTLG